MVDLKQRRPTFSVSMATAWCASVMYSLSEMDRFTVEQVVHVWSESMWYSQFWVVFCVHFDSSSSSVLFEFDFLWYCSIVVSLCFEHKMVLLLKGFFWTLAYVVAVMLLFAMYLFCFWCCWVLKRNGMFRRWFENAMVLKRECRGV